MKKVIQKQITSFFITCTVVSALTILSSCSPDSDKSDSIETIVSDEQSETSKDVINLKQILAWDSIRKSPISVSNMFKSSRNKFSFKPNSSFKNNTIHAYVGYNANANSLNFTFISKEADTIKNTSLINEKGALPVLEFGDFQSYQDSTQKSNNVDAITWTTANQRVKNWKNPNTRKTWIKALFEKGNTNIFQAFVINGIDFELDATHDCYLALKSDTIKGNSKTQDSIIYTADLIIVNTKTSKVVSFNKELEDVTAPIPPFKPLTDPRTDEKHFGLLETLKIK